MDTVNSKTVSAALLPEYLWQQLRALGTRFSLCPEKQHWVVAYSGGKDSSALAHLCAKLHQQGHLKKLTLMHIHHGLQSCADDWVTHCAAQATHWKVPFAFEKVAVVKQARTSVEAQARDARYQALRSFCRQNNAVLLLAHHLDDVLETVLLQLKRGAGPKGLAGMGEMTHQDGILHFRPLLNLEQQILIDYLYANGVGYIKDPSNDDQAIDRNFIRHALSPLLIERWPAIRQTVARSARLCAQQDGMIKEQVERWLDKHLTPLGNLPVTAFKEQSVNWQREIFRHWCKQQNGACPSLAQLENYLLALAAPEEKQPELQFANTLVRRYGGYLYIESSIANKQEDKMVLKGETELKLPHLGLSVSLSNQTHGETALFDYQLTSNDQVVLLKVNKNERIKTSTNATERALKRYLKEWQIPPWKRNSCYFLMLNGTPLALLAYGLCQRLAAYVPSADTRNENRFLSVRLLHH